jgi:hypothetical protein
LQGKFYYDTVSLISNDQSGRRLVWSDFDEVIHFPANKECHGLQASLRSSQVGAIHKLYLHSAMGDTSLPTLYLKKELAPPHLKKAGPPALDGGCPDGTPAGNIIAVAPRELMAYTT